MDEGKLCLHCIVKGKVQGVFFRAGTQDEAKRLGVTGYAKNLPDGSVEVIASGEREKVLALAEWLKSGPPRATVSEVNSKEIPFKQYDRFSVQ